MFIWTDLETTGLDPGTDEILALGMIITDNAFKEVARFEQVIHVPAGWKAMRDMSPYVLEMHTRSGLLEKVADSRDDLSYVEREACAFLDQHLGPAAEKITDRPPMAGNSVHFDRAFLLRHCPALITRFNYRLLDVSTLKVLSVATVPGAQAWNDSRPDAAHTPLADLEGSIAELAHWRAVLRGECDGGDCGHPCSKCGESYGSPCIYLDDRSERCPGSERRCICAGRRAA